MIPATKLPLLVVTLPAAPKFTLPALLASASAVSTTLSRPDELEIAAFTLMSLWAASVSVVAEPPVLAMALATVMSPVAPLSPPAVLGVLLPLVEMATLLLLRAVTMALASVASMVMSTGSISQSPALPCAAPASMRMPSRKLTVAAEVSMKPPSPPLAPPRARMVPPKSVRPSARLANSTALPPLPLSVALTSMRAPFSMTVELALRIAASRPWRPPPT